MFSKEKAMMIKAIREILNGCEEIPNEFCDLVCNDCTVCKAIQIVDYFYSIGGET